MKIFITGGRGFIGRNLYEQLKSKYSIYAPSSSELNLLDDVKVFEYLKQNKFNVIIHSATWNATVTSTKNTNFVLENNLRMFLNLIRGAEFYNKIIYFGSGAEFDRNHWIPKMNEDYFDTYIPADQYGLSKYIMNKFAEKSDKIINLRLFGVYGRYEDWRIRFISQTCCRVINNIEIKINQDVNFDYTYIDDVVKITEWFINNDPVFRTFNVCTGKVFSLSYLAKRILDIAGKKLDISVLKADIGREYSGDNQRLLGELKNYSFKNMDDCIKEIYNWYSINPVDTTKL